MSKILDRLYAANRHLVDDFSDESGPVTPGRTASECHDGYWFYLQAGWECPSSGCHCIHEWTVADVVRCLKNIQPCSCEDCLKTLAPQLVGLKRELNAEEEATLQAARVAHGAKQAARAAQPTARATLQTAMHTAAAEVFTRESPAAIDVSPAPVPAEFTDLSTEAPTAALRVSDSKSDPHDFCKSCAPTEAEAFERFGGMGDGPDGRGNCFAYDPDHPPYEDGYTCEDCGEELS